MSGQADKIPVTQQTKKTTQVILSYQEVSKN